MRFLKPFMLYVVVIATFVAMIGCGENPAASNDGETVDNSVVIVFRGEIITALLDSTYAGITNAIAGADRRPQAVQDTNPIINVKWIVTRTGQSDLEINNSNLQGISHVFSLADTAELQNVEMIATTRLGDILRAELDLKVKPYGINPEPVIVDSFDVNNLAHLRATESWLKNAPAPYGYKGDMNSWVMQTFNGAVVIVNGIRYVKFTMPIPEGTIGFLIAYQLNPDLYTDEAKSLLYDVATDRLVIVRKGDTLFTVTGKLLCIKGQSNDTVPDVFVKDSVTMWRSTQDSFYYWYKPPTVVDSFTLNFNYTGTANDYSFTDYKEKVSTSGWDNGYACYIFLKTNMQNLFRQEKATKFLSISGNPGHGLERTTISYNAATNRWEIAVTDPPEK